MPDERAAINFAPTSYDGLTHFTRSVFDSLPRSDQRRWAEVYLRGLLTVHGKKSIRNIAKTVLDDPSAMQSIQQFINQSPWDWTPVRARLAQDIQTVLRPRAWIIEHLVIPKRGRQSVGVEQRFVQRDGRTVNSQLGVSIFAASEAASLPMDWRLHLSGQWLQDPHRRARTRIPTDINHRSETDLVLDMIDELTTKWGLAPPLPIVASAQADDAIRLIEGLLERSLEFLIQIEGNGVTRTGRNLTSRSPESSAHGDSAAIGWLADQISENCDDVSRPHRLTMPRANGHIQEHSNHLVSAAVQLPQVGVSLAAANLTLRIVGQRPQSGSRITRASITNLPRSPVGKVISLEALRNRSATESRRLNAEFGLQDFEGRSYPGWHHHLTLVSAAATCAAFGTQPVR
jgi:hypothetical protein